MIGWKEQVSSVSFFFFVFHSIRGRAVSVTLCECGKQAAARKWWSQMLWKETFGEVRVRGRGISGFIKDDGHTRTHNILLTSTTHRLPQARSQTTHSFSLDFFSFLTIMIGICFLIVFVQLLCFTGKLESYLVVEQCVRLLSTTLWGVLICFCSQLRCFWEWHRGWKGVKAPFQTLHGITPNW